MHQVDGRAVGPGRDPLGRPPQGRLCWRRAIQTDDDRAQEVRSTSRVPILASRSGHRDRPPLSRRRLPLRPYDPGPLAGRAEGPLAPSPATPAARTRGWLMRRSAVALGRGVGFRSAVRRGGSPGRGRGRHWGRRRRAGGVRGFRGGRSPPRWVLARLPGRCGASPGPSGS